MRRDASGRLLETSNINFIAFQDRNGRKFMAIFTHPEALQRFKANVPTWIAIDGPSLCRLAMESEQSALQINPGSANFVELNLEEIRTLAKADAGA